MLVPLCRAVKLWNSIDKNTKELNTPHCFKTVNWYL